MTIETIPVKWRVLKDGECIGLVERDEPQDFPFEAWNKKKT